MTEHTSSGTVLGLIQAGGHGSRMDVLSRERAKPALPFAGGFRLIDFPLSALAHAGVTDVWVSVQYQSGSLDRHLAHGRPWDLDRSRGGLRQMPPQEGAGSRAQSGFAHGSADDLYQLRDALEQHGAELLVVCSADHVHDVDVAAVLAAHRHAGAEATMVTAEVGPSEARHHVVVHTGSGGRVSTVEEKPQQPSSGTVSAEIYVLDRRMLLAELEHLRRRQQDNDDDTGLGDLAHHLLPALAERGSLQAVPVTRYWKDVGRPEAYLQAHRDLLRGQIEAFTDPRRPVRTAPGSGLAAAVHDGAAVRDSLLGAGTVVRGTVERSVLGPGVVVQAGARVVDSVLFEDVVVEAGATVHTAVLDNRVRVGRDSTVGAAPRATRLRESDVTLLGADSIVRRTATLPPGTRMEPGSTT